MEDHGDNHAAPGAVVEPGHEHIECNDGEQKRCKRYVGPRLIAAWNKEQGETPCGMHDTNDDARSQGSALGLEAGLNIAAPAKLFHCRTRGDEQHEGKAREESCNASDL